MFFEKCFNNVECFEDVDFFSKNWIFDVFDDVYLGGFMKNVVGVVYQFGYCFVVFYIGFDEFCFWWNVFFFFSVQIVDDYYIVVFDKFLGYMRVYKVCFFSDDN